MANSERLEHLFSRSRRSAGRDFNRVPSLQQLASATAPVPGALPDGQVKARLLHKLAIVKRARFNAAKRLESMHEAGQLALAIAGIYGFLIPLFTLQFKGALAPMTVSIINFVAVVAGALSFAVGFLYQERNYRRRAEAHHACALEINRLRDDLAATRIAYEHEIRPFGERYAEIMSRYENHDDIDYRIARAERPIADDSDASHSVNLRRGMVLLRLECFLKTHGLNVAVWCIPPLVGLALWLFLPPSS